ncbi:cytochrome c class I [Prosthecochloris aestuarii DSM 271]|uniref:Cytochrome c class I n=1 Tax=Prosthecochloris aestuarii (strain DSM 271 / SK 413) TaxID=290512 RepID=B4S477_PROA2|nr:cytochrome c [Prosthecochloris aestuarii]ACF45325.1 cytochrome c class I [Prosthecochloris aestuarii DSM 271]
MKRILTVFSGVLIAASALICSSCSKPESTSDQPAVSETQQTTASGTDQSPETPASTVSADGKVLYEQHCQVCHSMQAPAKTAPPIIGLSSRYRQVFGNRDEAVSAMVAFMKSPSAEKSSLGPNALNRFGLMPAMTLGDEELTSVAGWLWDQYDPEFDLDQCR